MSDRFSARTRHAEQLLTEWGISELPIDPIQIAEDNGILVKAMSADKEGVSGMLVRNGNDFAIAYATHLGLEGFQRFSIAHELGHFFSPGHSEQLLQGGVHQSRAGFVSQDPIEKEADHFAAGLLMPRRLFQPEMRRLKVHGLAGIEAMRQKCGTSLTATAIQYVKYTDSPIAIVVSTGCRIDYCFISEAMQELPDLDWPRKGSLLPVGTETRAFNQDKAKITAGSEEEAISDVSEWLGGRWEIELREEIKGLGRYGKTLTVLTPAEPFDIEELLDEEELEESWTPRFKKR